MEILNDPSMSAIWTSATISRLH